jgi:hypothetical protein
MPRAFFRFLAVVVLAFAIPVQGMAAVTAGQCMAVGHHEDAAGHENHAHDGAVGHDQDSHSHADESGTQAHCDPCAACCASASIAGRVCISILPSPSDTTYVFSQFSPLGVQPDGFDRPPLAL